MYMNDIKSVIGKKIKDHALEISKDDDNAVHSDMLFLAKRIIERNECNTLEGMGKRAVDRVGITMSCREVLKDDVQYTASIGWHQIRDWCPQHANLSLDELVELRAWCENRFTRKLYALNYNEYLTELTRYYGTKFVGA